MGGCGVLAGLCSLGEQALGTVLGLLGGGRGVGDLLGRGAKRAAETARKAGVTFALVGALSLFIGAFIASAAAALGGRLRDDNEGALDLRS